MRIYFINLDRSPERLVEFKSLNGHLPHLERFRAVDGRDLDVGALAAEGLVSPDILKSYTVGALGLAVSHKKLWQMAIDSKQAVTIAEDDVIFHSQFESLAPAVIKTLPSDWDIVVWAWNFDAKMIFDMLPGVSPCVAQFNQNKMRMHARTFQTLTISPHAYRLLWSFGTGCYAISPKGAQNLSQKCFPLKPALIPWPEGALQESPGFPNVGLDAALDAVYRELQAYVCIPPLAISPNEHVKSTVQSERLVVVRPGASPVGSQLAAANAPAASGDVAMLVGSGVELQKLNRREEALAQFEAALLRKPEDVAALICRGNLLIDLGRFEQALANWDKLLALRPGDAGALNMRGLALENLKRPAEALASYDRAVAVAATSVEAHYNRGNVLADLGRCEEALASYDKALAIRPDIVPVLNNRGLVLEELKRFDEAIASYEQALKIKPDYAAAADNRKLLLEQLARAAVPSN